MENKQETSLTIDADTTFIDLVGMARLLIKYAEGERQETDKIAHLERLLTKHKNTAEQYRKQRIRMVALISKQAPEADPVAVVVTAPEAAEPTPKRRRAKVKTRQSRKRFGSWRTQAAATVRGKLSSEGETERLYLSGMYAAIARKNQIGTQERLPKTETSKYRLGVWLTARERAFVCAIIKDENRKRVARKHQKAKDERGKK